MTGISTPIGTEPLIDDAYKGVGRPATPLRTCALAVEDETPRSRVVGMLIAIGFSVAFLYAILQFWAPAHPGVDQNGYLVGGRQLAATGSTGLLPEHPLGFVGSMWVRVAETGVNYPKYPIGLSFLYAIPIWIFGNTHGGLGYQYAFLVSPIGAGLSVLGMYFLTRQFAGVFASLSAMLLMGSSQLLLTLANNPNSHASCLAFVVWGVFFLVRFWQTASAWRGVLGGFLLGFAVTIRYTEGLLGLLIAIVVLSMIHWRNWRSWLRASWPAVGWVIPVGYLVIFNLVAMGTPTGYDTTNESKPGSAFTVEHMHENWEKLIRQVHDSGLFFAVPIGLLGMFLAWRSGWRRAAILWAWLLPGALVYMSYYWAPDRGVSYLRFFLTLLPPLAIGVAIIFDAISRQQNTKRWVATIACAGVLAMACGLSLYRTVAGLEDGQPSAFALENMQRSQANLAALGQVVTRVAPAGSVLFAAPNQLHYLQFLGDYVCFSPEYFTTNFARRLESTVAKIDETTDPMGHQGERRRWLLSVVENKSEAVLDQMFLDLIRSSIEADRQVFFVTSQRWMDAYAKRLFRKDSPFAWKTVARYNEMPKVDIHRDESGVPTDPVAKVVGRGAAKPNPRDTPQVWIIVQVTLKPLSKS
jgi:hypothetical protein